MDQKRLEIEKSRVRKFGPKHRLRIGSRDLDVENGFQEWFCVLKEMRNDFLDSILSENDRKWRILERKRERI